MQPVRQVRSVYPRDPCRTRLDRLGHSRALRDGRLAQTVEEKVYELSATSAAWIGAKLADVQLLLTVEARSNSYDVDGFLVHSDARGVRDVVPLEPQSIPKSAAVRRQ